MSAPIPNSDIEDLINFNLPSAEEVYNLIMKDIDDDLTTQSIPLLSSRYENETPKQHINRCKRYEKSFLEYEQSFNTWLSEVHEKYNAAKKQLSTKAKKASGDSDKNRLSEIEDLFGDIKAT